MSATVGAFHATPVDVRLMPSTPMEHADLPCSLRRCCRVRAVGPLQRDLGDDVYRFYRADIQFSGSDYVFSITVEGSKAMTVARVHQRRADG